MSSFSFRFWPARAAAEEIGALQSAWISRIGGSLLVLPLLFIDRRRRAHFHEKRWPCLCHGPARCLGTSALFAAGRTPQPELATVCSSAAGAITVILAALILKEKVKPGRWTRHRPRLRRRSRLCRSPNKVTCSCSKLTPNQIESFEQRRLCRCRGSARRGPDRGGAVALRATLLGQVPDRPLSGRMELAARPRSRGSDTADLQWLEIRPHCRLDRPAFRRRRGLREAARMAGRPARPGQCDLEAAGYQAARIPPGRLLQ